MPRFADVGIQQSNTIQPTTRPRRVAATMQSPLVQRQSEDAGDEQAPTEQSGQLETAGGEDGATGGDEGVDATKLSTREGQLRGGTIVFDEIEIPNFKTEKHRRKLYQKNNLQRPRDYKRGNTEQRKIWTDHVGANLDGIKKKLDRELPPRKAVESYVFKYGDRHYYIGDIETIARQLSIPKWGPKGDYVHTFDVDHIVELQLGGSNTIDNMELLEKSVNRSSGKTIDHSIDRKVTSFIAATNGKHGKTPASIKKNYTLVFENAVAGEGGKEPTKNDSWELEDILDGDQVKELEYSKEGIDKPSDDGKVYVFSSPAGGQAKGFDWPGPINKGNHEHTWLDPFEIVEKEFYIEEKDAAKSLGRFLVGVPQGDATWEGGEQEVDVLRMGDEQHIGYIDKPAVLTFLKGLRVKGMSPIRVDALDIDSGGGISARGAILPDVPLLRGQQIPFEMRDGQVTITHEITAADIALPAPFQIRKALLQVSASSETGLGLHGSVSFGIDGVGEGSVEAGVGEQGVSLAGAFDFDSKLFDPARVTLSYKDNKFQGSGKLAIAPNKVPGLEKATLDVTVDGESIKGKGTLKPSLPGFEQGTAKLSYSPDKGLELGADVAFDVAPLDRTTVHLGYQDGSMSAGVETGISAGRLPGVESATLDLQVAGDKFSGDGTLVPAFPGLNKAEVDVSHDPATGLALGGTFTFDSGLFESTKIELGYAKGKLHGGAQVDIAQGRVPGVDAASLTINFDDDEASGSGTITPALPGLDQANAWFSYSQSKGYRIGAHLSVSDLPHVEQGELTAEVSAPPGGKQYGLTANGKLSVGVAGLKATAAADYQNGAFTVVGKAAYKRGLAAGTISIGVTNRALSKDGRLLNRIGDQVRPFGQGSLTLSLTDWLTGTAGIRLMPNGEIEVRGALEIPDEVELFKRKSFEKELFDIGFRIPIIGPLRIRISGGMSADAGVGPGTLRDAGLGVTYNPDHPDKTKVDGRANFVVPADAGLTLFVRGSVGAGVPGLEADVGIEVSGRMGVDGALDTGIELDWTPTEGVAIDAQAAIHAQPRFRFTVSGFASATALLWEGEKKWELASYEYGSALRFGMKVPVHYDSKTGFELSWDDVELEIPDIDTLELIEGLLDNTGSESEESEEDE